MPGIAKGVCFPEVAGYIGVTRQRPAQLAIGNSNPAAQGMLFYLVKNMNIALSREKLLEEVWGFDFYGDDRTVDTHIKMLRNSLGKYRNLIVTLRGMGYKFEKIQ